MKSLFTLSMVSALAAGMVAEVAVAQSSGGGRLKQYAQKPQPAGSQAPWRVECATGSGKAICKASQQLKMARSGQLLLAVSVRIPQGAKNPAMLFQLPHGIFLPEGVALTVDKTDIAKKQPVQTCDAKGCYVGLALDRKKLDQLRAGKVMTISFKTLAKKDFRINVSLNGFKEAYDKLI